MHTEIVRHKAHLLAVILVTFVFSSCGGGTTGTSSSDTLKFVGYAEQPDGSRGAFLSMTVSSGVSGQDLKDSGTNARGDFEMALPARESLLVVDVVNVGSTTVQRQQQGAGNLSARLLATEQGLAADLEFEAQISSENLCPRLEASGDELIVVSDDEVGSCPVTVATASRELSLGDFEGSVVATCGDASPISSAQAGADGQITLALGGALDSECAALQIVISHPEAPGLESVFYVR